MTTILWLLVIVGLGAFAPQVEKRVSGAGWQASGSESVTVRERAREHFGGAASSAIQVVVRSTDGPVTQGDGARVLAERVLDRGIALLGRLLRHRQLLVTDSVTASPAPEN